MATVEEIEQAIERLAPPDFSRLASWVIALDQERWTQQMNRDAEAGKLDFLFAEAEAERKSGTLRDWPGEKRRQSASKSPGGTKENYHVSFVPPGLCFLQPPGSQR